MTVWLSARIAAATGAHMLRHETICNSHHQPLEFLKRVTLYCSARAEWPPCSGQTDESDSAAVQKPMGGFRDRQGFQ
jgi:hypothetical protein